MTGFGKGSVNIGEKRYNIEIRSLNSKQSDFNIKLPNGFKDKELDVRKVLSEHLHRGKVDFNMMLENGGHQPNQTINTDLLKAYIVELQNALSETDLKLNETVLLNLLNMPEIWVSKQDELEDQTWQDALEQIAKVVLLLVDFRKTEGQEMEKDLVSQVDAIEALLSQVEIPEKQRIERVKERIRMSLQEVTEQEQIDTNRFEQELIYYIEKYDISEEKIRLKTHCNFFKETLKQDHPVGKKLNFIAQEMGREINTLGSKANDAEIQNLVVRMKDHLEKIKEQCFNIL